MAYTSSSCRCRDRKGTPPRPGRGQGRGPGPVSRIAASRTLPWGLAGWRAGTGGQASWQAGGPVPEAEGLREQARAKPQKTCATVGTRTTGKTRGKGQRNAAGLAWIGPVSGGKFGLAAVLCLALPRARPPGWFISQRISRESEVEHLCGWVAHGAFVSALELLRSCSGALPALLETLEEQQQHRLVVSRRFLERPCTSLQPLLQHLFEVRAKRRMVSLKARPE